MAKKGTTILQDQYKKTKENRHAMIRELVLEHKRIDVLAEYVINKEEDPPEWFHEEMMEFQDDNPEGMILAWRGCRKSNYCTITRIIAEILWDNDVRILVASDAAEQAKTILRGVKVHFERNEELIEIFGDFKADAEKWSDTEIIVNRRRKLYKEATVTAVGIGTRLPMRHFEIIIGDDLVTDENSDTEGQRRQTHNWFYKTLLPCLEPDGKMWIIGTRWHSEDLYGWLEKEDYADCTFVLAVLDVTADESVWEERFPTAKMHRIRKGNLEAFELQYQQNATGGHGGIFTADHFRYYDDLPGSFFKWQAADLATGERARNDYFAHVTGARDRSSKDIFLVAFREMKIQFPRQVKFIGEAFDEHPDTTRVIIEANAYQVVMAQQVREVFPEVPVMPLWTVKDKVTRAHQLATIATYNPFYIRRQHHKFLRRMLAFPNGPKDLFDAFSMMVTAALRGAKKTRRKEPGLI